MPLPRVRIVVDATGPKLVEIDGEDLSSAVSEVGLKASPGSVPEIWIMQHGEAEIEGEAIVRVVREQESHIDRGELIGEFLDSIDVEQLEADALNDVGLGDSGTQALLDQLKRYAQGL